MPEAICPKCHQLFPSLRSMYAHWKETDHVKVTRSDAEMQEAIDSVEPEPAGERLES